MTPRTLPALLLSVVRSWACLFFLLLSAALLAANDPVLLRVAWNNPFNPSRGEDTAFEYQRQDADGPVALFLFAADGRLVMELARHDAQANTLYTRRWDGKNEEGRLVDSGVYFVALEAGPYRKVRRIAVLRK
jgi:hypothetical protein